MVTNCPDEFHVDEDVIESRYPTIGDFYFSWRGAYETAFEEQECHLGSTAEVFPDPRVRVAWEVEGLLLACWLAFQDDVEGVEYMPGKTAYQVEKGETVAVLCQFLRETGTLLEA